MEHLIKKYSNRKLYDTAESRYITLHGIADLIRQGADVRVIDNESREDLTALTLSQILMESERNQRGILPSFVVTEVIRKGSDALVDRVRKSVREGLDVVSSAQEEIGRGIRRFFDRDVIEEESRFGRRLFDWFQHGREDIEHQIDGSVRRFLKRHDLPHHQDVERLEASMKRLEKALGKLKEKREAAPQRSPDRPDLEDAGDDA